MKRTPFKRKTGLNKLGIKKRPKTRPRGKQRASRGKEKSISKLMHEADRLMSLFIRQKYADKDGNVTCYTCPYTAHWKKMQNGHLVSRFYKETRYDERNCRPQDEYCNYHKQLY